MPTERKQIDYKAGDPPGEIQPGWRLASSDHDSILSVVVLEAEPDNLVVQITNSVTKEKTQAPLAKGRSYTFEEVSDPAVGK